MMVLWSARRASSSVIMVRVSAFFNLQSIISMSVESFCVDDGCCEALTAIMIRHHIRKVGLLTIAQCAMLQLGAQ